MIVLPVDQGDADIGPASKFLRRIQAGETTSRDDDMFHEAAPSCSVSL